MIFVFGSCFLQISIVLLSFTVIKFMSLFCFVSYDSISQNSCFVDVSNADLLVIEQVDVLWFPPNKTQPNVLCNAIGLL